MTPYVLAPFGNSGEISQFLLRIAFMDEIPASKAVLQAILALSSLKLSGNTESVIFKANAISMLAAAVKYKMAQLNVCDA
jgi:hypothetical protein